MTLALKIACRTIRRRLQMGESFADILLNYPKLTQKQVKEIRMEVMP